MNPPEIVTLQLLFVEKFRASMHQCLPGVNRVDSANLRIKQ